MRRGKIDMKCMTLTRSTSVTLGHSVCIESRGVS